MIYNSKLRFHFVFILFATNLICGVLTSYHVVMSDSYMRFLSKELVSAYHHSINQTNNMTNGTPGKKLFPITKENTKLRWKTIEGEEYLLMVNVFENAAKYESGRQVKLDQGDVWVTAFPELYDFCMGYIEKHSQANMSDVGLRIHQLLGLPADKVGYTLVELWVKPSDLFRPCPNPDITREECDDDFPEETTEEHATWMKQLQAVNNENALKNEEYGGLPWTRLGYTYDWSPESEDNIGLSEYVVRKGSKVYVQNVHTINAYCQGVCDLEEIST